MRSSACGAPLRNTTHRGRLSRHSGLEASAWKLGGVYARREAPRGVFDLPLLCEEKRDHESAYERVGKAAGQAAGQARQRRPGSGALARSARGRRRLEGRGISTTIVALAETRPLGSWVDCPSTVPFSAIPQSGAQGHALAARPRFHAVTPPARLQSAPVRPR